MKRNKTTSGAKSKKLSGTLLRTPSCFLSPRNLKQNNSPDVDQPASPIEI